jgi:hypothetical protein
VDGRDIGTVVFPDAELKVFLTASPEARAGRRISQRGTTVDPERLEAETHALAARDRADSSRSVAPLRAAADAVPLDTTSMTFADQVRFILELARPIFGHRCESVSAKLKHALRATLFSFPVSTKNDVTAIRRRSCSTPLEVVDRSWIPL